MYDTQDFPLSFIVQIFKKPFLACIPNFIPDNVNLSKLLLCF